MNMRRLIIIVLAIALTFVTIEIIFNPDEPDISHDSLQRYE